MFLALLFFFGGRKILFISCVVGFYRSQSQLIAAQASQALAKVQHVRLCCELAGLCCDGCDRLCSLVSIHREASSAVVRPASTCVKPGFRETTVQCCQHCRTSSANQKRKKAVYLSLSPKINRIEVMPQANEFILARDQQPIASLKFSTTAECLKYSCESLVFIQTGTQN